jgi:protein-tyrosine phosphatase
VIGDDDEVLQALNKVKAIPLEDALRKVQLTVKIRQCRGGYSEYAKMYPFMCTNHPDYAEGRLYPSEVLPRLYISAACLASSAEVLRCLDISAVVNATVSEPNHFESTKTSSNSTVRYLRVPVVDDADENIQHYFEVACKFISDALERNDGAVLVHCKHGQSRSATILGAFLVASKGLEANQSIDHLKSCRTKVSPNPGFMAQLSEFKQRIGRGGESRGAEPNSQ